MSWDDLSMREKAAMMRVAVKNKIFEIDKIKEAYNNQDRQVSNSRVINPNQYTPSVNLNINPALDYVGNALESISGYEYEGNPLNKLGIDMSFDLGTTGSRMYPNGIRIVKKFGEGGNYTVGNLVDAIYQNNPKEEFLEAPNRDYTQSEEWANAHGYYPDAKGHRDDRVKKPAHPSHPSRGTWQGDNFILTGKGFEDPNYTLFGLNDGGQDPYATLIYDDTIVLPEITVTPNGKYINNSYDNIRLHLKSNGGSINRFDDGGGRTVNKFQDGGFYLPYSINDIPVELRSPDPEDVQRYLREKDEEIKHKERRQTALRNIVSFIPFAGTILSEREFVDNPTIRNGVNFGIDLVTDFLPGVKLFSKPLSKMGTRVEGIPLWMVGLGSDILSLDTSNGMGIFTQFGGEGESVPIQKINPYITNVELHKTPQEKQAEQEVNNKIKQNFQPNNAINKISENAVWNQPPSNSTTSFRLGMPSWQQQQKWKANKSKKK